MGKTALLSLLGVIAIGVLSFRTAPAEEPGAPTKARAGAADSAIPCRHRCRIERVDDRPDLLALAGRVPAGTPMFYWERPEAGEAMLAVYFALAPSSVPAWRLDPVRRIAAVLPVGEPTPSLWGSDRDLRP